MKNLILVLFSALLSCSFQPNNSDGIIVLKTSEDTLTLGIIDSYHTIKDFSSCQIGDTLFLNVNAIHSPDENEKPICITIPKDISIVKIQNDKVVNIDSIPYSGSHRK